MKNFNNNTTNNEYRNLIEALKEVLADKIDETMWQYEHHIGK